MKHLVTGGSGFLGSLIVKSLRERGEEVSVLDVIDDPTRPTGVQFHSCNILDRQGVRKALQGVQVVHHNAALVPLTKAGKKFKLVNVGGSEIVAEESAKAGVKNFIHMSSCAVYGLPERCPITENTPLKPIEEYGRSKLEGEKKVKNVCQKYGMPLVIIRPRTILGSGRLGLFQLIFDRIRKGKPVYLIGKGNYLFQFIHAKDLIELYLLALSKGYQGVLNMGTDTFGTLNETLEHLIRFAKSTSEIRHLPANLTMASLRLLNLLRLNPFAPWQYLSHYRAFHFDVTPLLQLGWKPKYSNAAMFEECYTYYLAEWETLGSKGGSIHRQPMKQYLLGLLQKFL